MVKKIIKEVLLLFLILGFWINYTAFSQTEKPIPNYQTIYDSMVTMKNVLAGQLNEANVSFSYIPGFGSIFICEVQGNLEKIIEQETELIKSFEPLLKIEDKESICVVIKYEGKPKKEEYVIVAPKMSIADVEGWKIFSSGIGTSAQSIQIIEDITPEKVYSLIQSYRQGCSCRMKNFGIIDVRTPEEYANGHIENAINLNYYSKTFRDELDKLDRSKTYFIYCRSGIRSKKALNIMKELGFTKVYNMLGGITQWEAKGLPTTK
ncbi:MAG: rhodanese-like domain-containing protein [Candidatus Aerophobetes bacterium]|nr:rhodanese-like domain-containing protein [Candidatus Aerophobetes bacterium]